jgi:CrcB protein
MVGLGGASGSILRYICHRWVYSFYPHPFPLGTLLVNVTGCFLIGVFYSLSEKSNLLTPEWRLLLTTGFCGGFTTFSAFTFEGINLLKENKPGLLLIYIAASVLIGLLATYFGMRLAK